MTSKTEPSGAVTTYPLYDAAGRLIDTVIPAGGTISNTYNAQGRLETVSYPDGLP